MIPVGAIAANALRAGGGGGGPTISAARMRSLSNGGSHRVTLCELDFLDGGGSEISTSGGTAFEGGSGGVNLSPSFAFDGNNGTRWSRVSTGGTCFLGMLYASPITEPEACRFVTADWGNADQESPVTFVIEVSSDTTNGTDGTWTTIYTSGTESWTGAQQTRTFTF